MRHPQALLPPEVRIGRWTLHAARDELALGEHHVKLEPRLTQVLLALCAQAGDVVGSQALHDEVWGRVRVTPGSLYEAVARLRRVLAADLHTPEFIATVPRRGYRLVAPVARLDVDKTGGPRLAVLPFRATGLDASLAPLRERLLEGLSAALSRHTPCTVMAHGSSLALAAGVDPVGQVAAMFSARFIVDGSIAGGARGVDIRIELIDAPTRELLWTEVEQGPPQDGPELAGPVVERLARALSFQLMTALAREPCGALTEGRRLAMGSWVELFCRPQNAATNERAWALVRQSLVQDESEALALVMRAYAGWRAAAYGWQGVERTSGMHAAMADVQRALALAPEMHDAHFVLSIVSMSLSEEARAEAAARHCLRLVPDHAPAWGMLGIHRAVRGHPEETAALCARALELSPCEPLRATWHWHIARAALDLGEPEQALDAAQQAMAANADLSGAYLCGVTAAQQLGRTDLAGRWLDWIRTHTRYTSVARYLQVVPNNTAANGRHRDQVAQALGAAGLPLA